MATRASQIGQRIREAREKSGLTQAQLASRVGVHEQTVIRWESGKTDDIKSGKLAKLAEVVGVEAGDLTGVTAGRTTDSQAAIKNVPRGSAPRVPVAAREISDILRALRLLQNDVEREVIQGGADELLPEVALLFAQITGRLARILGYARGGAVEADASAGPTNEEIAAATGARATQPAKVSLQELEREAVAKHAAKKGGGRRRA